MKKRLRDVFIPFFLFFLLLPSHAFPASDHQKDKAEEHYRLGEIYYEHGLYHEAEGEFKKSLDILGESLPERSKKGGEGAAEPLTSRIKEYVITTDDILSVDVWNIPDLRREVVVRPDGMISFPLIGDTKAAGLTVRQLDEEITKKLTDFAKKKLGLSPSESLKDESEYLIGKGDTLIISVWRSPDLSHEVIVRPDGMISFPLIGDIYAIDKTLKQLDDTVTKKLSDYIKNPQVSIMVKSFGWKKEIGEAFLTEEPEVSVMIVRFGGKKVIVLGEVKSPGVYSFTHEIKAFEAIGLAGGFTRYAVRNNVLVVRGDVHNNPQVIKSNLLALIKNAKLSENVSIESQDVVYVPKSFIGNIQDFLYELAPLIDRAYEGYSTEQLMEHVR